MKVTCIIKDKTDLFYEQLAGIEDKFHYLAHGQHYNISVKIGSSNAFRDRVELNQITRGPHQIIYKLENRKGYRLATFEITKGV
jgi:hypothetical protein